MKKILVFFLVLNTCSCNNTDTHKSDIQMGYEVAQKYCFQCHTTAGGGSSIAFSNLLVDRSTENSVRLYLSNEFVFDHKRLGHDTLNYELEMKEIELLLAFISHLNAHH